MASPIFMRLGADGQATVSVAGSKVSVGAGEGAIVGVGVSVGNDKGVIVAGINVAASEIKVSVKITSVGISVEVGDDGITVSVTIGMVAVKSAGMLFFSRPLSNSMMRTITKIIATTNLNRSYPGAYFGPWVCAIRSALFLFVG
jgi:hypothetical protein